MWLCSSWPSRRSISHVPLAPSPLEYEGLRERYLPEVTFRGRVEHRNSQYAIYAAACMPGGPQPDHRAPRTAAATAAATGWRTRRSVTAMTALRRVLACQGAALRRR